MNKSLGAEESTAMTNTCEGRDKVKTGRKVSVVIAYAVEDKLNGF